jgi:hypothetical protein
MTSMMFSKVLHRKMVLLFGLLAISCFLLRSHEVCGYMNETTHPILTVQSLRLYVQKIGHLQYTSKIIDGSIDEDVPGFWTIVRLELQPWQSAPVPFVVGINARYFRHFYDPTRDNGLDYGGKEYESAVDWAIDSSVQSAWVEDFTTSLSPPSDWEYSAYVADFSWERAVQLYEEGRKEEAFLCLGHVLHLLQDMAVPDHVRNDVHLTDTKWRGGKCWLQYEAYVERTGNPIEDTSVDALLIRDGCDPKDFFKELAAHTSRFFFSFDTIDLPDYPLPDAALAKEVLSVNSEGDRVAYLWQKYEDDKYYHLACKGFWAKSWKPYYVLDDECYKDYWNRLSLKACQYSAGLIKLFMETVGELPQPTDSDGPSISNTNFINNGAYSSTSTSLNVKVTATDDSGINGYWVCAYVDQRNGQPLPTELIQCALSKPAVVGCPSVKPIIPAVKEYNLDISVSPYRHTLPCYGDELVVELAFFDTQGNVRYYQDSIKYEGITINFDPTIAMTPMSGPPGTTFVQWGTGFRETRWHRISHSVSQLGQYRTFRS